MAYTVKKGKLFIRLGKTRNAFHTKKEAKVVRAYYKLMHPRAKNIKVVKIK